MNNSQLAKSKLHFMPTLITSIILGIAHNILFVILLSVPAALMPMVYVELIMAILIDLILLIICIAACIAAIKYKKKPSRSYGKSVKMSFGVLLFALTVFITAFIFVLIEGSKGGGRGDIVLFFAPIFLACIIMAPISLLTGIINLILYRKANNRENKNEF